MNVISKADFEKECRGVGIRNMATASIRQISDLSSRLEKYLGEPFVHMQLGNPGLPASQIGIEAECAALRAGVASQYPNISGLPELKENGSKFIKAFLNIDIPPRCIIPTVGSMQGAFSMFQLLAKRIPERDAILFLDPGFSAHHSQAKLVGLKEVSLDIYGYRGEALEAKLEEILSKGNVTAIIYSSPNNPAWFNFTDTERAIIARMADKYDVIVIEDLAYLGMDFRTRYGVPYKEPYVPTIANFTSNCVLLISASKIFSYAGQRVSMVCMTPDVAERVYQTFEDFFDLSKFIDAYVYGVLYNATTGTAHSAQYAYAAMLKAAVEGRLDFVKEAQEYGRRAKIAKRLFTENGFHIVYDKDGKEPIADGFFFTIGYKEMTGIELQKELICYGISTVPLCAMGSTKEGLRICISKMDNDTMFDYLGKRLALFNKDHS